MRGGQHDRNHTPEGLEKLRHMLSTKKSELAMLVSMCAGKEVIEFQQMLLVHLVYITAFSWPH